MRKTAIHAALAAVLGIGSATAFAASHDDHQAEIKALESAKVGLAEAIANAEQQGKGKAVDAGIEHEDGKTVFEIELLNNATLSKVFIDPATGKAMEPLKEEGAEKGEAKEADKDELKAAQSAKITLGEAIALAEQHVKGKAMDAGIEDEHGKALYEVEVLKDAKIHKVMVHPETGKVISAKAAEED